MASILKVDKLDPQSGTALEIGTSGDTVSIPSGATLDISSATLTPPATMPASSGVNFTALNATNLGSGTVPTARLGTGTASSSTILYGDNTWAAAGGGGKILQVVTNSYSTEESTTSTSYQNSSADITITPVSTSNKVLILGQINCGSYKTTGSASTAASMSVGLFRDDKDGTQLTYGDVAFSYTPSDSGTTYSLSGIYPFAYLDSPSTTSAQTYTACYKSLAAGWTAYMQWGANQSGTYSSIMTALEVEG